MAEGPLSKVARLLGGLVLMQGRLGHQVLGQLLVAGTNDAAVAGAAVVVAGTMRSRNAAAQVAIRTAAPAIAVHGLLQRQEKRLIRRGKLVAERERLIAEHDRMLERQKRGLEAAVTALQDANASLQLENARLQDENRQAAEERATTTTAYVGAVDDNTRLRQKMQALEDELRRVIAEGRSLVAEPTPKTPKTKTPRAPKTSKRAKRGRPPRSKPGR